MTEDCVDLVDLGERDAIDAGDSTLRLEGFGDLPTLIGFFCAAFFTVLPFLGEFVLLDFEVETS